MAVGKNGGGNGCYHNCYSPYICLPLWMLKRSKAAGNNKFYILSIGVEWFYPLPLFLCPNFSPFGLFFMLFMVVSPTSRQNRLFFAKIGQNC